MVSSALIPLLRPFAAVSSLALASCALGPQGPPQKAEHGMYEWNDDYGPGDVKVKIGLGEQRATYTRGGREIG